MKEEIIGDKNAFPYWFKLCCFLTRECNIRCRGCKVVKYKSDKPELTTSDWKRAFDIAKYYKVKFIVLFGGEPTLRQDLPELIRYLNSINLSHTIITNSLRLVKDEDYYQKFIAAKPYGVSASINEISHGKAKFGDQIKSGAGYKLLKRLKVDLPDTDLVANMCINKETIKQLPSAIKQLSNDGFWSILTLLHINTNPELNNRFTYRENINNENKHLMFTKEDKKLLRNFSDWLLENYDSLLLHNQKPYIRNIPNYIDISWHCKYLVNLSCDCYGAQVFPCIEFPLDTNFSIFDIPGREKELQAAFDRTISRQPLCTCAYDHLIEQNVLAGRIEKGEITREDADNIFAHKTKEQLRKLNK